ncbi:MAG TPA: glycoside hydrolase family 104 protein [Candidatus Obscuribacterales bacterium]
MTNLPEHHKFLRSQGIPLQKQIAGIAGSCASLSLALLLVLGAAMSPKAMPQGGGYAIAQTTDSYSARDIYVDTLNDADNTPPSNVAPPTNTTSSSIKSPEMRAFLDVISWAETGKIDPSSYQTLVFNGKFNNFSTHPKIKQCAAIKGKRICSTAAGRYQIMGFNWDELASKLQLKDFSPESQDKMALYFIEKKKATADILAGRFEQAACKVGKVWASIPPPCNQYGQSHLTMAKLRKVYDERLEFYKGQ